MTPKPPAPESHASAPEAGVQRPPVGRRVPTGSSTLAMPPSSRGSACAPHPRLSPVLPLLGRGPSLSPSQSPSSRESAQISPLGVLHPVAFRRSLEASASRWVLVRAEGSALLSQGSGHALLESKGVWVGVRRTSSSRRASGHLAARPMPPWSHVPPLRSLLSLSSALAGAAQAGPSSPRTHLGPSRSGKGRAEQPQDRWFLPRVQALLPANPWLFRQEGRELLTCESRETETEAVGGLTAGQ